MPIQQTYKTGTITVTSGSATVTGSGTAWTMGLVNGGELSFKGFSIPIIAVASDTSLTLDYAAPAGMAGAGSYSISLGRADAASAIVANRQLADLVDILRTKVSPFAATLLDDLTAEAARATLGAAAPLGFTPVQQGGGLGQFGNNLKFGWSGTAIKAQVDATDMGSIWTSAAAPAAGEFQKLPSGLLIQRGRRIVATDSFGDARINFATPFASTDYAIIVGGANPAVGGTASISYPVYANETRSASGCYAATKPASPNINVDLMFLAIGIAP